MSYTAKFVVAESREKSELVAQVAKAADHLKRLQAMTPAPDPEGYVAKFVVADHQPSTKLESRLERAIANLERLEKMA